MLQVGGGVSKLGKRRKNKRGGTRERRKRAVVQAKEAKVADKADAPQGAGLFDFINKSLGAWRGVAWRGVGAWCGWSSGLYLGRASTDYQLAVDAGSGKLVVPLPLPQACQRAGGHEGFWHRQMQDWHQGMVST